MAATPRAKFDAAVQVIRSLPKNGKMWFATMTTENMPINKPCYRVIMTQNAPQVHSNTEDS